MSNTIDPMLLPQQPNGRILVLPQKPPFAGYVQALSHTSYLEQRFGAYGFDGIEWCSGVAPRQMDEPAHYWAKVSVKGMVVGKEQSLSQPTIVYRQLAGLLSEFHEAILDCDVVYGTATYDHKTRKGRADILTLVGHTYGKDPNGEDDLNVVICSERGEQHIPGTLTTWRSPPPYHPLKAWPVGAQVLYAEYTCNIPDSKGKYDTVFEGGPNVRRVHQMIAQAAQQQK